MCTVMWASMSVAVHILVTITHLHQRVLAALVDKLERVDAVPCTESRMHSSQAIVLRNLTLTL